MFTNMKLRYRILLGYAVPLVLFLAVATLVYVDVRHLSDSSDLAQKTFKIVNLSIEAELGVSIEMRANRGYLLSRDENLLKVSADGNKQFTKAIDALRILVTDAEQKARVDKAAELQNVISDIEQKSVSLMKEGKASAAIAMALSGNPVFDEIKTVFDKFGNLENVLLEEREKQRIATTNELIRTVWGGVLLATLASILIGLWMTGRISSSINEQINALSASSTEIAATMTEHERTVGEQSAAVTEVSATAEELGVSSQTSATAV